MKDILLGVAIGDAFGFGIEFSDRQWIQDNVDFTKYVNNRTGKWAAGYKCGMYSDDTEMTIGLMNAMMDKREFTSDLLLEHWKREYDDFKAKHSYGRPGHGSVKRYYEGQCSIKAVQDFQRNKKYPGNAPPMRAIPLGFAGDKLEEYAVINADATHPHPKARDASVIIARAAEFIFVKDGDLSDVIQYCKLFVKDAETKIFLDNVDLLNSIDYNLLCGPQPLTFIPVNGIGSDSMRTAGAALYMVKHATDTFDGLQQAMLVGGDVDSLGSIVCGLLAGRYGLDSLPQFLFDDLQSKSYIEGIADDFSSHHLNP